jgi:hypothetical protein
MEDGGWRMENGEWRMENGEWRMENGEWRMKDETEQVHLLATSLCDANVYPCRRLIPSSR